jgi:choline monooxygenase
MPVLLEVWEPFVFVHLNRAERNLQETYSGVAKLLAPFEIHKLQFFERRVYELACNWKVFVDNYLDGGYHVPHIHRGLNSVLEYSEYTIENGDEYCVQSSPMRSSGADAVTASVRGGDRAVYLWLYPNFMINCYEGVMDTNLVLPLAIDRCRVIFDFYFSNLSGNSGEKNHKSVEVSEHIQLEDVGVCESVQRGLRSRAYGSGRLSVRREAGEHLFHRLLARDLKRGLQAAAD